MVSTPALDIHSYHIITRGIMAHIARQQTSKPAVQKPWNATAPAVPSYLSQDTLRLNMHVAACPQPSRPPQPSRAVSQQVTQFDTPSNLREANFGTANSQGIGHSIPPPQSTTREQTCQAIQLDDTSDHATSSTIDINDTRVTDDVYDARLGDDTDLTEYVSGIP